MICRATLRRPTHPFQGPRSPNRPKSFRSHPLKRGFFIHFEGGFVFHPSGVCALFLRDSFFGVFKGQPKGKQPFWGVGLLKKTDPSYPPLKPQAPWPLNETRADRSERTAAATPPLRPWPATNPTPCCCMRGTLRTPTGMRRGFPQGASKRCIGTKLEFAYTS